MTDHDHTPRMCDIRHSRLDEHGNRVIDIELTAVRTHPAEVRRALKAKGPFELRYWVRRGDSVKTGLVDPEAPSFRLVFQHGKDPDGVWLLEIEASDPDGRWERELWRQQLFVQSRLRLTHAEIDELARRHAPVFIFSRDERYFPVSLQTLLGAPIIQASTETMSIRTVFGKQAIPLPRLGDFMRFNGHSEYLLDFSFLGMRRSIFATLGGNPRDATMYYSYIEDPQSERFFITYHQLYAFDTKAGLAKLTGIGPHVFDRESMILVFDGSRQPRAMIISGHLENQTIFLFEKLKLWTQGRIRVDFDDPRTLKLGTHPVVAVAEGSHALYPTSGVYHLSLLREIAGYLHPSIMPECRTARQVADAIDPEQILTPPSVTTSRLPSYDLRSFGLDRMTSHIDPAESDYDGHNAYLAFSGYWVDVAGPQNARFPPFTRKDTEITDWVDAAYEWNWDDIPERYHRNNSLILDFLRENLEDF